MHNLRASVGIDNGANSRLNATNHRTHTAGQIDNESDIDGMPLDCLLALDGAADAAASSDVTGDSAANASATSHNFALVSGRTTDSHAGAADSLEVSRAEAPDAVVLCGAGASGTFANAERAPHLVASPALLEPAVGPSFHKTRLAPAALAVAADHAVASRTGSSSADASAPDPITRAGCDVPGPDADATGYSVVPGTANSHADTAASDIAG